MESTKSKDGPSKHPHRASLLIAALFAVTACDEGTAEPDATEDFRIVGGVTADDGEYRFATAIFFGNPSRFSQFCGGTLISPQWVMTAAHCMQGLEPGEIRIGTDRLRLTDYNRENTRGATAIFVHPQYGAGAADNNDVALVRLDAPFDGVPTADLATPQQDTDSTRPGDSLTAIGWGDVQQGGRASNVLREVDLPVVGLSQCRTTYGNAVTQRMICAGDFENGGIDSCQGDSGGPLVGRLDDRFVVFGITSFGFGCAQARNPGVYTRVRAVRSWVQSCMQDQTTCG